jgi:hypothetical protein
MPLDLILLLAQQAPPTDSVTSVLAWVVGGLCFVVVSIVSWHLYTLNSHKAEVATIRAEHRAELLDLTNKREKDQKRMLKLALRVQKGLEAIADIEAATLVDDDEEED